MWNKIITSAVSLVVMANITSCDFEDKNIDPNNSSTIELGPLLTYTQLNTTTGGDCKNMQIGTCMMLVQQTATLNMNEASAGDKYYQMNSASTSYFEDYYSSPIKNWRELQILAEEKGDENMLGVAKIWGAYLMQRVTDLFGNVPYTEAGMGYHGQIYKPKYDKQEDIYNGLISEVKAGLQLLSDEKKAIQGDIFYDGDVSKWKKFGNSLLLRLGMRLSKVNPELAKSVASEAINGGIMSDASDMCKVKHIDGGRDGLKNPLSLRFRTDDYINKDAVKISNTFIDYLKGTNDPRIKVYCSLKDGDNDPSKQIGLPNGYDNNTIAGYIGYVGLENYSNFNTNTILKMDAPTIFLMASESILLKAEAVLKGWISGDANSLYEEAVTLSMKEQSIAYNYTITDDEITAYLNQNLFSKENSVENKLKVLGEQYWVATFMNGYESYANWRRCGYPKLNPTNYAGNESNGQIPRRLTYSSDEYTINRQNVLDANQQQGEDKVTTHIWWDK